MTDAYSTNKIRAAFFASVAVNIFLVAFTLGRSSTPGFMPEPGFGGHHVFPPGMHDGPPPFRHPGDMPPTFFGSDDLFTPDEMRANETRMHEDFDKIEALRTGFATQLEAGPVSKEDVLKHFADIDRIMDSVKREAQAKAADKISAMSPDERHKFAQALLDKGAPR